MVRWPVCRWPIAGGYMLCAIVLISAAGCLGDGNSPTSSAASALGLRGTPATQVQVGQLYSFKPASSDPVGQDVGYSIQNKPNWASFSIGTGQLTGTPSSADVGAYPNILITASTGDSTVSLPSFTIKVLAHQGLAKTALDDYGGIVAVNCTNPNVTSYFGMATVANHKVLCDPEGHPYFGRGFYVMDDTGAGNDESGKNNANYTGLKYGSEVRWANEQLTRMQAWGFNMVGPYESSYVLPWSGTNRKVPFIFQEETCANSWSNRFGYGTAPVKDVISPSSPNWHGGNFAGITDYEDPAWMSYVDTMLSSRGDYYYQQLLAASAISKSYLVGVIGCDSDDTHGFEAGPDFRTYPFPGYNDLRLSYLVALDSPVEWASTRQKQIYNDSTVYSKKAFYTQLRGEYANISALNTAWGSSYTTFGTSGTCYGAHFGAWLCPNPSSAASVGTGNGSTVTFTATLNTTVSANSVAIFVGGTLVGGDNGDGNYVSSAGQIYGPNLSGTINYSTGALSITFTSGGAPVSGAAITAEYIANGWGVGSGVMDEDGRESHRSWTGTNPGCIDGVGDSSVCTGGYASSGMVSDLNTLDETLAAKYASTFQSAIHSNLPGALFIGPDTCGTWNDPPNRYVLQGMAPYIAVCVLGGIVEGDFTQKMLDFMHTYGGDIALGITQYNTANFDSPFAWPGSSCTRSGTTVTCTVTAPHNFSTGQLIQTSCKDTSYNVFEVYPNSVGANTVVYKAPQMPMSPGTTCNVAQASTFQDYPTQSARANAVSRQMEALPTARYSADGVYPYVLDIWWQWFDPQDQYMSLGIVDTRDNAYNGLETTTSKSTCSAPLASYTCGGELRSGWGNDDGLTPLINANDTIDSDMAELGSASSSAAN